MAFEINLLDNASGEDLDDLAVRVPNCRTFTAPTNLGFGGGHNLLAAKTGAQYLLILNPDVEFLFPDTVRRLLLPVAGATGSRRPGQSCSRPQVRLSPTTTGDCTGSGRRSR